MSSVASSCRTSATSSAVIRPRSRRPVSTTGSARYPCRRSSQAASSWSASGADRQCLGRDVGERRGRTGQDQVAHRHDADQAAVPVRGVDIEHLLLLLAPAAKLGNRPVHGEPLRQRGHLRRHDPARRLGRVRLERADFRHVLRAQARGEVPPALLRARGRGGRPGRPAGTRQARPPPPAAPCRGGPARQRRGASRGARTRRVPGRGARRPPPRNPGAGGSAPRPHPPAARPRGGPRPRSPAPAPGQGRFCRPAQLVLCRSWRYPL